METKRIGIDARLLNQTGVGVYIRNLLKELTSITDKTHEFYIYVRKEDVNDLPSLPKNSTIRHTSAQWHSFAEQTNFLQQLYADNLDLMHFCYFSMPIFYTRPFVITIHDVIPFKHPTGKASTKNQFFYSFKHLMYKRVLAHAISHAKKIFVPSDAVKSDILKLFSFANSKKIIKTYEGVDYRLKEAKAEPIPHALDKPYFLYMGNYYPHKNVETLITAFSKAQIDAILILCGPSDFFSKKIDARIYDLDMTEKIIRLSNLSIGQRVWLYKNALALIHPSKDEGFGLTLIEATYFNCPVIASDILVLRETCPDATFFRPDDPLELKDLLENIFKKGPIHKKTRSSFSFKKMAETTYNQYKETL
jgi:glycosyltransferase involved in cell wall biosynthesis